MSEGSGTVVVTGIGVASPYGVGLERLEAGLLASECRLRPLARFSPEFAATVAEYTGDLPDAGRAGRWLSRSDQLAVAAARDAMGADLLRDTGVVMATTVAGLGELEPQLVADPAAWYRAGGLPTRGDLPGGECRRGRGRSGGRAGPALRRQRGLRFGRNRHRAGRPDVPGRRGPRDAGGRQRRPVPIHAQRVSFAAGRSIRNLAVRSTWIGAVSTLGKAPPCSGWKPWNARVRGARLCWLCCAAGL